MFFSVGHVRFYLRGFYKGYSKASVNLSTNLGRTKNLGPFREVAGVEGQVHGQMERPVHASGTSACCRYVVLFFLFCVMS